MHNLCCFIYRGLQKRLTSVASIPQNLLIEIIDTLGNTIKERVISKAGRFVVFYSI